ncbi:hypothetical protein EOD39_21947 [Acipenser ruthenus]|uniref:Uncharacterized protein n=1 Tax=Acipenser ruthenus TaxID=7906 RepID=A0A444URA3_ACIRT|nr:hypothetical protein EOD39_21947 [Acipenser ruthenus]
MTGHNSLLKDHMICPGLAWASDLVGFNDLLQDVVDVSCVETDLLQVQVRQDRVQQVRYVLAQHTQPLHGTAVETRVGWGVTSCENLLQPCNHETRPNAQGLKTLTWTAFQLSSILRCTALAFQPTQTNCKLVYMKRFKNFIMS